MKKRGFTLIELLVVIAIIAMLLAILMPALNKVKKIAIRVVCATNLKGLGTAQAVYANEYEDQWARQCSSVPVAGTQITWAAGMSGWQNSNENWNDPTQSYVITVSSSLYLLVREADVSPKSFVCGGGGQTAYDGTNLVGADLVELWDFSATPKAYVSYSYHMPYSKYAASGSASAAFAAMADKNPWMDPKLTFVDLGDVTADNFTEHVAKIGPYYSNPAFQKYQIQAANAYPHGREGQNVTFGDGHASYEKTSDVGVRHDNIYTRQLASLPNNENPIRQGDVATDIYEPTAVVGNLQPRTGTDSMLVNDDN